MKSRLAYLVGTLLMAAAVLGRDRPPDVPPPAPLKLPLPNVDQLPNGLRIVVVERRSLPILTLHLLVQSGAEADPPELPGLAQLTAQVLAQGTSRRNAQEISDAVDFMGAQLSTGAGWDQSRAELTVLSDQAERAIELLAEIVRNPTFPKEEVERKQQQTVSAIELLRDDPAYMADTIFHVLVFRGTPYGHPLDGTVESVRKLSKRDLQQFHRQHYQPGNCILALVGDTNSSEALALTRKFFGNWKGSPVPSTPAAAPRLRGPEGRHLVVDKPDAVQTEIRVGCVVSRRDSSDYPALTVANQVLGGPAVNRLYQELRSRQGLAYGAESEIDFQRTVGIWVAKTSTRTAQTARGLRDVLDEVDRLSRDHVSARELDMARNFLVGHMALEFETSDDVAAQFLELLEYRLPLDYWNDIPRKFLAVEPADVSLVARRSWASDHRTMVLVGDARRFSGDLGKLGNFETIELENLDFASPSLRRPE